MMNWTPRSLDIPLSFLGEGKHKAEVYEDAPDAGRPPTHVDICQETVDATSPMKANLAAGGGFAVHFVPLR